MVPCAAAAEAIVVFDTDVVDVAQLRLHVKRSGHLASKSRFLAAQLVAYLVQQRAPPL